MPPAGGDAGPGLSWDLREGELCHSLPGSRQMPTPEAHSAVLGHQALIQATWELEEVRGTAERDSPATLESLSDTEHKTAGMKSLKK